MRTALKSWFLNSGGGSLAINAPKISVYSKDQTTAFPFWTYNGDAPYTLQRDTDPGFSSPAELYSGSNLSYSDSGLSAGTTYYYRVKSSGSDWDSTSVKTISFTPSFWHEVTGLKVNSTNDYGTLSNLLVDQVKSIINTSGPSLNFNSLKWATKQTITYKYPNQSITNGNSKPLDLSSPITYTGDFTLSWILRITITPVNHYLFSNTANANQWLRISNLTTAQCRIGTSGVLGLTFTTPLELNKFYHIVFKRAGSAASISMDGGATFSSTVNVGTSSHTIDRFFADSVLNGPLNCDLIRDVGAASVLTSSQINEISNYNNANTSSPKAAISNPSITGLTLPNNLASGGYFGSVYPHNGLGAYWRDRALMVGKHLVVVLSKQSTAPDYGEDVLRVIDVTKSSGNLSDDFALGVPYNNPDVHNSGSIIDTGVNLTHWEANLHYDQTLETNLWVKRLGDNYDFSNIQALPVLKGMIGQAANVRTPGYISQGQYHQGIQYNGKQYMIWQGSGSAYLSFAVSSDEFMSCDVYQITVGTTGNDYMYPQRIHSEDGWMYIALSKADFSAGSRYTESWLLKINLATLTLYNIPETFSVALDLNTTAVTVAQLRTNFSLVDARALSGSARPGFCFFDPNLNLLYGVVGDGDSTKWRYWKSEGANSAITFIDIPNAGRTPIFADNNDLQIALLMTTSTTGKFYCFDLSGSSKWELISISTTDEWSTSSFDGVLSQDATKQHTRLTIPKNITYSPYKALLCHRELDAGTNADVEYFNVT